MYLKQAREIEISKQQKSIPILDDSSWYTNYEQLHLFHTRRTADKSISNMFSALEKQTTKHISEKYPLNRFQWSVLSSVNKFSAPP